jgi:uncharacterized membrane protein
VRPSVDLNLCRITSILTLEAINKFHIDIGAAMSLKEDNKSLVFTESRLRSLVKSLIYRIVSIIGTTIISWIITKDIKETISITVVIQVFLIIIYYSSERVWNRINWGRIIYYK